MASLSSSVLLFSGMKRAFDLESTTRRAIECGHPLTLPKTSISPRINQLMSALTIEERYRSDLATSKSVSEYLQWSKLTAKSHTSLHEIGAIKRSGRCSADQRRTIASASSVCMAAGLFAVLERDQASIELELESFRKLATSAPILDTDAAAVHARLLNKYCVLMQLAAESATTAEQIDALDQLVRKWHVPDYSTAAKHLTAEWLENEELQSTTISMCGEGRSEFDLYDSAPNVNKRKTEAIENGMSAVAHWDNPKTILDASNQNESVVDMAGYLKHLELEAIVSLRAVFATLRAHRLRVVGGAWPSIDELSNQGLNVTHPLNNAPFRWLSVRCKQRIASLPNCDEALPFAAVLSDGHLSLSEWAGTVLQKIEVQK